MRDFTAQLMLDINKLVGTLLSEDELVEILKRKLTKKEFKYYKARLEDTDDTALLSLLNCDQERLEEIKKQTILKINQEKFKKRTYRVMIYNIALALFLL